MQFKILTLATASLLAVAAAPAERRQARLRRLGLRSVRRWTARSSRATISGPMSTATGTRTPRSRPTAPRPVRSSLCPTAPRRDVRQIVEQLASDPNRDHLGQQVGDYYASFMDTNAIEAAGHRAAEALPRRDQRGEDARRSCCRCSSSPASPARSISASARTSRTRTSMPLRRPGAPRHAEPRILSRRQRQDEGAPRRLSRLYHHHREARRPARSGGRSRPHHRARDRALEGAVAGRRPPRHRQDLQSDDPRAAGQAGAAVRLERDARQGRPRQRQDGHRDRAVGGRRRRQDPRLDAASTWKEWLAFRFVSDHASVLPEGVRRRALQLLFEAAVAAFSSSASAGSAASPAVNGALGEGVGEIYVEVALSGRDPSGR